jgi:putative aminopeptidase FrvX
MPEADTDALKAAIRRTTVELATIPGIPGHEQAVAAEMRRRLERLTDEVTVDRFGNVFGVRRGRGTGPRLLLAAHTDEIGFLVKSVEPAGFLRFERLGGATEFSLIGQKVVVDGRHHGVIGVRPGHLSREAEKKLPAVSEMYIDVGVTSAAEARALGIDTGSTVTFATPITATANPDRLIGHAVDDRLGLAVLQHALEQIQGAPAGDVIAVATAQEEVGLRGAEVAAFRAQPDYALAIDTIPVGDTPDVHPTKELPLSLGRGPALILAAGSGQRGAITHPAVRRHLLTAAEHAGVSLQQVLVLNMANTDATAIHLSREGVPTGTISLPRRYSHSPVEMFDLNDAAGAVRLLARFVAEMDGHDLAFCRD